MDKKELRALLAEPVVDWRKAHADALAELSKTTEERDELRAEVEMLRGVGCMEADKAGEDPNGPCGACRKCAYHRGAEAMREAAIRAVSYDDYSSLIRDLPVPEDKG